MKTLPAIANFSLRLLVALVAGGLGGHSFAGSAELTSAGRSFLNLPLYFEPSRNVAAGDFQFIARGQSRSVQLAPQRAMLSLVKVTRNSTDRHSIAEADGVSGRSVAFEFLDANPRAQMVGEGELPGRINYFLGNDSTEWQRGLSTFLRIRAQLVYPGIDLVYYGNQERLEYDFVIQPGAHPGRIAFQVIGADHLRVDANGDLVIKLGVEEIRQLKPVAYQEFGGVRHTVRAAYRLRGQTVSFELGAYDRTQPLVIDPILNLLAFFNGSGSDIAWDLAIQSDATNGFLFVTGETMSANLPATPGAFTNQYAGGSSVGGDVFVAKLDLSVNTSNLVYLTYLGGRAHDGGFALDVDAGGNAYLTGYTASTNFPIVGTLRTNLNGGIRTTPSVQNVDAFVAKLTADGSNLVYSAFLGGSGVDEGFGIAVDPAGMAYVTGFSDSTNFPTANTTVTNKGGADVFVTRISADGQGFAYSLYAGGFTTDRGYAVTADAAGNAYVCGFTRSFDFPITTNTAFQVLHNGRTNTATGADVFLLKVLPGGTVDYASFFGGERDDIAFNLTRDLAGNLYLCGSTASTNFVLTTTNIPNTLAANTGIADAFVTKFDAALTNIVYSIAFGGTAKDEAWDVAADSLGRTVVVGDTLSSGLPVTNTAGFLNPDHSGSADAFAGRLNVAGTALDYLGYLGGSGSDLGYAVKVDASDNVYFVGQNGSKEFPKDFPVAPALGGTADGFVAKILNDAVIAVERDNENVVLSWPAFEPEYQVVSAITLPPTNGWRVVSNPPVVIGGRHTVTLPATNDASFFRLRLQ